MDNFDKQKKLALTGLDLSRKGSIDTPIFDLISFVNNLTDYFTTSSCSGRIIIFDDSATRENINSDQDTQGRGSIVKKKGCKWLYTTHDVANQQQVKDSLLDVSGNAVFKFEPFVLHVQCRTLQHAQVILSSAVASGFRNSGISVGNKGKYVVGVRSTHSLEVPLSNQGKVLVEEEYITFLVDLANKKMTENFHRLNRFFHNFKESLTKVPPMKDKKEYKLKQKCLTTVQNNSLPQFDSSVEDTDLATCNLFDGIDMT